VSRPLTDAFDPTQYTRYRAPVVDEFMYEGKDDSGAEIRVKLSAKFLATTADNMNRKWEEKGDLSPIVIGHTVKGAKEIDQPPKVGYLHNYEVAPFGKDATPTLWADHWIKNEETVPVNGVPLKLSHAEIVERWPRRSGEIWLGLCEVDPHSLLGATTPHRSLGLLKLAEDGHGSVGYESPGGLKMADEKKPDTGAAANADAKLDQVLGMLGQLLEAFQTATAGGTQGAAQAQPSGAGHSDAEVEEFLKSLGEGEGGNEPPADEKPAEKPKKKEEKPDEESDEKVKLERERDEAVLKLKRSEVTSKLTELKDKYLVDIDPTDEQTVADYLMLPDEAFQRAVARLQRNGKGAPPGDGKGGLNDAVRQQVGTPPATGKRKVATAEDRSKVVKLAMQKKVDFASAAKELGFELQ
jgi:hypothetical protein